MQQVGGTWLYSSYHCMDCIGAHRELGKRLRLLISSCGTYAGDLDVTSSEAQTRAELIDLQLARAGWNVNDPTQVVEEFDILTSLPEGVAEARTPYEGHQFSDYVLLGKDGKPLAVIEAKKSSRDAVVGREQAKQYCYNIQRQLGGELPFCFYTNGHDLYFWDLENAPPRKVVGFPTRDDLERFLYIRRNRKPLKQLARFGEADLGIYPQREQLLLAAEPVLQAPVAAAALSHFQVQAVAVPMAARLGAAQGGVAELVGRLGHGGPRYPHVGMYPPKYPLVRRDAMGWGGTPRNKKPASERGFQGFRRIG